MLKKGILSFGRGPSANIQIPDDKKVSKKHFAIRREGEGYIVRDFKSRNGVFVNGQRIDFEQALREGDEIQIGDTRLVFREDVDLDGTDDRNVRNEAGTTQLDKTLRER